MDPVTFAFLLAGSVLSSAPCEYEDASELQQRQSCFWDGGENSYFAVRGSDTVTLTKTGETTVVHITYYFTDGHVERGGWEE